MNYKTKELSNGIKVVCVKTPEFRSINIQMTLRGGPAIETKEENGWTHFLEHMVLKGTKNFPDTDAFDENIEFLGGGYNGYTSSNKIYFHISLPDTHLDYGIKYMNDVSKNALFTEESFKKEKKTILDEIHNSDNGPYEKYTNFWNKNRFTKETEPLRILGKKSKIKATTIEDLKGWYKNLFFSDNITFVIVGNIEFDDCFNSVEKYFKDAPGEGRSCNDLEFTPLKLSDRQIKLQVEEKEKQTLNSISFPSLSMIPDSYRERQMAWIIADSLANYRSSILFTKLRKEAGLLYSISANNLFGENEGGLFEINFETSDNNLLRIYKTIMDEIDSFKNQGMTSKTLQHSIERGNNRLKMGYTSMSSITWWFSSPLFWYGEVMSFDEAIDIRNSITLEEVNKMILKIFDYSKLNVISRVKNKATATAIKKLFRENYL